MAQSNKSSQQALDALPEVRRKILLAIKSKGTVSASDLAKTLGFTREAARQQLQLLQKQQLIISHQQSKNSVGRPVLLFSLSSQGEHLFPKQYDKLSLLLIESLQEQLEPKQFDAVLSTLSEKQADQWQAQLEGLDLKQKLNKLKDLYFTNDPYTEIIEDHTGLWLIEKNCPYLSIAMQKPALCSVSVNTLARLLGVKVVREKRFQDGDGYCAFHIYPDQRL